MLGVDEVMEPTLATINEEKGVPTTTKGVEKGDELSAQQAKDSISSLDPWTLFELGKAAMKDRNLSEAVDLYSQVLDNLVPILGQFAKELGPVYVAYGKALLQLGIENKDNLLLNTNAMTESVVEGIAATTELENRKRAKVVNLDEVTFEDEYDDEEAASEEQEDQDQDENENDDEQDEKEEDELQLAWEILDVARLIYADSASMDLGSKGRLAEIHCDLGDVAMETELFKQAADEFGKAIELKKTLSTDAGEEREMASVHFKLAMALEYDGKFAEAINPLTSSLGFLKRRLDQLFLDGGDDKGKERATATVGDANAEADELMQLIPDIEAKIEDIHVQLNNTTGGTNGDANANEVKVAVAAAAQGAIQDLSGLVKKRKALE